MVEKCPKCDKSFSSEKALNQHLEDYDHNKQKKSDTISFREELDSWDYIGGSLIFLFLISAAILIFSAVTESGSTQDVNHVSNEGDPVLGSETANVTIAYFGDYNCSSCLYFEQNIFSDLEDQVIDEGEAKFVKKNFPVINHQSPNLAHASRSVWNQVDDSEPETFWEWHGLMYDNQGSYTSNWATVDRIVAITEQVEGLDAQKVREDINNREYESEIDRNLNEGRTAGVRGTPTFIIYNEETGASETLVGPQPVIEFQNTVSRLS